MATTQLETDYLIIGSGAVGMAFADTLLSESDADIIIVDRHPKPGGHWNIAYPFVRLHQPAAFYGVSSHELSNGKLDEVGLNKGLGHLSSGAEVLAYFDNVMQERFLPSGRVRYFPVCVYQEDNKFISVITGKEFEVTVNKKRVDATFLKTTVPANHTPNFKIDADVNFIPINDLPNVQSKPDCFVIVGGGKTGIDACLWLLENGVEPDKIQWVMPRDAWLLDRRNTQPDVEFFNDTLGGQALQFEAIAAASSIDNLFDRLEKSGLLLRIDEDIKPQMFHGATISQAELHELRRIKNIIRKGRITHLKKTEIIFKEDTLNMPSNTVYVDCSARAITNEDIIPIFQDGLITPQTVRSYQPVFSASLTAYVEATRETDKEKNGLCGVVPLPNHDTDWLRMMIPFMMNQYQWSRDKELREWLQHNRLDGFSGLVRNIDKDDTEKQDIMARIKESSMPAMANLQKLVAEIK